MNVTSVRNAPPLFGSDLIDAIPDAVIRAGAVDRGDGVRGRPNVVRGIDGRKRVGRFGWKAHVSTLELFVAEAFRSELGLTSPLAPAGVRSAAPPTPARSDPCAEQPAEVTRDDLTAVVAFLSALPAPAPAAPTPPARRCSRRPAAPPVTFPRCGRAGARSSCTPICSCTTWAGPWTTA